MSEALDAKWINPDRLADDLDKLLKKTVQKRVYDKKWKLQDIQETPETQAMTKGLEFAFKIRWDFAPNQIEVGMRQFEHMTDEELDVAIAKLES